MNDARATLSSSADETCAACYGILEQQINHLWFEGVEITLCNACMALGTEGFSESLSTEEIQQLVEARADPLSPISDIEKRVMTWIARNR